MTSAQDTTFLDYVRGGLKINLAVAVDMTGSNGKPNSPESLHFIHPNTGENAYTTAMRTVGEILQDYDFGKFSKGIDWLIHTETFQTRRSWGWGLGPT